MALSSPGFPKPGWAAAAQGDRGVGEGCGCESGGVREGAPVWILRVPRRTDGRAVTGMPVREDASWQKMHSCVDGERCEGGICSCQPAG